MSDYEKKGPFVKTDGGVSDREIWKADMDPAIEKKFDDYLYAKKLHKVITIELAKRNIETAYESLMESFK